MQKSLKPLRTIDNLLHHYLTGSMLKEVVCVYSMSDGEMTYSERHWPTSPNEQSLIIPKQLVLRIKKQFPEAKNYS